MEHKKEEHTFSIEMVSKSSLSNVSITSKSTEPVLIQGELGRLLNVCFQENVTLEITGVKGVLRLDIDRQELETFLARKPTSREDLVQCLGIERGG